MLGDEPIWGYAKNFRVGLAQSSAPGAAGPSELDLVIVGAIVFMRLRPAGLVSR